MFGDCWPIGRPSIIWFPNAPRFLGQKFNEYFMLHQMSSWNDWDKYINIWQRKMRHVKNLGERVWKESSLELSPSTFLAENWIILARRHLWMKAVACGLVKSQPPGSTLTIWLVLPNRQTNANVQGFGWGLCSCTCCTIFNFPVRRPCWWQLLLWIGMVFGKSHTLKRCPRPWTFQFRTTHESCSSLSNHWRQISGTCETCNMQTHGRRQLATCLPQTQYLCMLET